MSLQYMTCAYSLKRRKPSFKVHSGCPGKSIIRDASGGTSVNPASCAFCRQYMKTADFYVHRAEDTHLPGLRDYHTEGLRENHRHPELQLVIDMKLEKSVKILDHLAKDVCVGRVFTAGEELSGLPRYRMGRLIDAGHMLRLILPDKNGYFPGDAHCMAPFHLQLQDVGGE